MLKLVFIFHENRGIWICQQNTDIFTRMYAHNLVSTFPVQSLIERNGGNYRSIFRLFEVTYTKLLFLRL